jgi:hypothetical protein
MLSFTVVSVTTNYLVGLFNCLNNWNETLCSKIGIYFRNETLCCRIGTYFIVMIIIISYGQAMYEGILSTQSRSDLATQSLGVSFSHKKTSPQA